MDRIEDIMLKEVRQRKTNVSIWSHLCVESKQKKTNKQTNYLTDTENLLVVVREGREQEEVGDGNQNI